MTPPESKTILADTSAWICFFSRKGFTDIKDTICRLLDENRVSITGPVVIELIQGARTEREKDNIQHYINGIQWLPIMDEIWVSTADMAFYLRRKGITVSAIDALIATVAIHNNCILLHKDSDYDLIAKYTDLSVYNL